MGPAKKVLFHRKATRVGGVCSWNHAVAFEDNPDSSRRTDIVKSQREFVLLFGISDERDQRILIDCFCLFWQFFDLEVG